MKIKIGIEHSMYGYSDFNKELFDDSKSDLLEILQMYVDKGLMPQIGTMIFPNSSESVYWVKEICYYKHSICFWVDDEEKRVLEE